MCVEAMLVAGIRQRDAGILSGTWPSARDSLGLRRRETAQATRKGPATAVRFVKVLTPAPLVCLGSDRPVRRHCDLGRTVRRAGFSGDFAGWPPPSRLDATRPLATACGQVRHPRDFSKGREEGMNGCKSRSHDDIEHCRGTACVAVEPHHQVGSRSRLQE